MNRRRYLAALGAATALAGCASFDDSETETDPETNGTSRPDADTATDSPSASPTDSETPTATDEPPAPADVAVAAQYYKETRRGESTEAVVGGELQNRGEQTAGTVQASGKFYDDDGALVDTTVTELLDLAGGETWAVWLPFRDDAADIADGTLEATFEPGSDIETPASVSLDGHSLKDASSGSRPPRVTGEARNEGEELSYLEARVKFYDADGVVLASGTDHVNNVGAGETWAFEVVFDAYNDDWADRVDSHRVALSR